MMYDNNCEHADMSRLGKARKNQKLNKRSHSQINQKESTETFHSDFLDDDWSNFFHFCFAPHDCVH